MRVQRWILMCLLSSFIAAPAAAFKVKPGEWEKEIWIDVYGHQKASKRKTCLTPEQAEYEYDAAYGSSNALLEFNLTEGCTGKITKKRLNSYDVETVCDYTSMKMKIRETVKKVSDTEIFTTASVLTESDDGQSGSKMKIRIKKISEDETLIETHSKPISFPGKKTPGPYKTTDRYKKIGDDEFVQHTTMQDEDKHCRPTTARTTMVTIYRYRGPVCTGPDEDKNDARQKTAPDGIPPEKATPR